MRRIMGLETEYGISVPGDPRPTRCSCRARSSACMPPRRASVPTSRAGTTPSRTRCATPGVGARPAVGDPSQLTDVEDPTPPTSCSPTGPATTSTTPTRSTARPRSRCRATPCLGPGRAIAIALESVRLLAPRPGQLPVNLYKNNADGKGQSYGTHENYLMPRRTPFPDIVAPPHPVLRDAPGRLRRRPRRHGPSTQGPGYQIAQRADFFETEVGPRDDAQAAASSTPATSRTPSPTATAGCTSSSATPTCSTSPASSSSAPRRSCWA